MSRPVRLTAAAERDLASAAEWYRQEAPHIIPRFRQAIREARMRIGESPLACPVVYRELRRVVVHRFPYSMFYRLQGESVVVVAIVHQARDPRVWQRR